ncbi:Sm-like ribonucleoprotein [Hypoxylon fragiforme]|uniref:Sm-like ribonucleoprotein n=1 Tax=Hypoxylon fragiforme TaxID=63214 RepID=UPI0020C5DC72|nr:Sm-like ribonucleoprotein [Hypoxylon fragiforme]KAI2613714.1 Sm-like ribonucleoprotein [Hypoxylon fragiforme]
MSNKQGKMAGYINYRMRVTLMDGRQMTGQMLAFDKHMNLVLADTEEFRRVKRKQNKPTAPGASSSAAQTIETEEKRTLGLTILRGAHIVSLSVESAPPADPSTRLGKSTPGGLATGLTSGPGVSRPAGRGAAPTSLAGPAAGVGGGVPPPFPQFPGAPGFPGRGGPPAPGFPPGGFPPGFPQNAPGQFPPPGFNPAGGPPPGFNPPPRR